MRLGMVGLGQFGPQFARLFHAHPDVEELVVCDAVPERMDRVRSSLGDVSVVDTFDRLCESEVDAVAIFTQRWMHGPMTLQALGAGKHVYSAVPMGIAVDEIQAILEAVERTGLVYMSGETSFYYPAVLFCREKWRRGEFGDVVYAEGEYIHDMSHGFYDAYRYSGGDRWKATASFPPMLYPTHSVSSVLSVIDSAVTSVSCLGVRDRADDGVFDVEISDWGNDFSNESALFELAGGGAVRINELRRVGVPNREPSVRLSMLGTRGSFEQHTGSAVWGTLDELQDVTELLRPGAGVRDRDVLEQEVSAELLEGFHAGFSPVHDPSRLPTEFARMPNGHQGSHQFLVDDFVRACATSTVPPVHAWRAARYAVPGIVAHDSARQGGARLPVPDFGPGPAIG